MARSRRPRRKGGSALKNSQDGCKGGKESHGDLRKVFVDDTDGSLLGALAEDWKIQQPTTINPSPITNQHAERKDRATDGGVP
jgi:hypothetical protein